MSMCDQSLISGYEECRYTSPCIRAELDMQPEPGTLLHTPCGTVLAFIAPGSPSVHANHWWRSDAWSASELARVGVVGSRSAKKLASDGPSSVAGKKIVSIMDTYAGGGSVFGMHPMTVDKPSKTGRAVFNLATSLSLCGYWAVVDIADEGAMSGIDPFAALDERLARALRLMRSTWTGQGPLVVSEQSICMYMEPANNSCRGGSTAAWLAACVLSVTGSLSGWWARRVRGSEQELHVGSPHTCAAASWITADALQALRDAPMRAASRQMAIEKATPATDDSCHQYTVCAAFPGGGVAVGDVQPEKLRYTSMSARAYCPKAPLDMKIVVPVVGYQAVRGIASAPSPLERWVVRHVASASGTVTTLLFDRCIVQSENSFRHGAHCDAADNASAGDNCNSVDLLVSGEQGFGLDEDTSRPGHREPSEFFADEAEEGEPFHDDGDGEGDVEGDECDEDCDDNDSHGVGGYDEGDDASNCSGFIVSDEGDWFGSSSNCDDSAHGGSGHDTPETEADIEADADAKPLRHARRRNRAVLISSSDDEDYKPVSKPKRKRRRIRLGSGSSPSDESMVRQPVDRLVPTSPRVRGVPLAQSRPAKNDQSMRDSVDLCIESQSDGCASMDNKKPIRKRVCRLADVVHRRKRRGVRRLIDDEAEASSDDEDEEENEGYVSGLLASSDDDGSECGHIDPKAAQKLASEQAQMEDAALHEEVHRWGGKSESVLDTAWSCVENCTDRQLVKASRQAGLQDGVDLVELKRRLCARESARGVESRFKAATKCAASFADMLDLQDIPMFKTRSEKRRRRALDRLDDYISGSKSGLGVTVSAVRATASPTVASVDTPAFARVMHASVWTALKNAVSAYVGGPSDAGRRAIQTQFRLTDDELAQVLVYIRAGAAPLSRASRFGQVTARQDVVSIDKTRNQQHHTSMIDQVCTGRNSTSVRPVQRVNQPNYDPPNEPLHPVRAVSPIAGSGTQHGMPITGRTVDESRDRRTRSWMLLTTSVQKKRVSTPVTSGLSGLLHDDDVSDDALLESDKCTLLSDMVHASWGIGTPDDDVLVDEGVKVALLLQELERAALLGHAPRTLVLLQQVLQRQRAVFRQRCGSVWSVWQQLLLVVLRLSGRVHRNRHPATPFLEAALLAENAWPQSTTPGWIVPKAITAVISDVCDMAKCHTPARYELKAGLPQFSKSSPLVCTPRGAASRADSCPAPPRAHCWFHGCTPRLAGNGQLVCNCTCECDSMDCAGGQHVRHTGHARSSSRTRVRETAPTVPMPYEVTEYSSTGASLEVCQQEAMLRSCVTHRPGVSCSEQRLDSQLVWNPNTVKALPRGRSNEMLKEASRRVVKNSYERKKQAPPRAWASTHADGYAAGHWSALAGKLAPAAGTGRTPDIECAEAVLIPALRAGKGSPVLSGLPWWQTMSISLGLVPSQSQSQSQKSDALHTGIAAPSSYACSLLLGTLLCSPVVCGVVKSVSNPTIVHGVVGTTSVFALAASRGGQQASELEDWCVVYTDRMCSSLASIPAVVDTGSKSAAAGDAIAEQSAVARSVARSVLRVLTSARSASRTCMTLAVAHAKQLGHPHGITNSVHVPVSMRFNIAPFIASLRVHHSGTDCAPDAESVLWVDHPGVSLSGGHLLPPSLNTCTSPASASIPMGGHMGRAVVARVASILTPWNMQDVFKIAACRAIEACLVSGSSADSSAARMFVSALLQSVSAAHSVDAASTEKPSIDWRHVFPALGTVLESMHETNSMSMGSHETEHRSRDYLQASPSGSIHALIRYLMTRPHTAPTRTAVGMPTDAPEFMGMADSYILPAVVAPLCARVYLDLYGATHMPATHIGSALKPVRRSASSPAYNEPPSTSLWWVSVVRTLAHWACAGRRAGGMHNMEHLVRVASDEAGLVAVDPGVWLGSILPGVSENGMTAVDGGSWLDNGLVYVTDMLSGVDSSYAVVFVGRMLRLFLCATADKCDVLQPCLWFPKHAAASRRMVLSLHSLSDVSGWHCWGPGAFSEICTTLANFFVEQASRHTKPARSSIPVAAVLVVHAVAVVASTRVAAALGCSERHQWDAGVYTRLVADWYYQRVQTTRERRSAWHALLAPSDLALLVTNRAMETWPMIGMQTGFSLRGFAHSTHILPLLQSLSGQDASVVEQWSAGILGVCGRGCKRQRMRTLPSDCARCKFCSDCCVLPGAGLLDGDRDRRTSNIRSSGNHASVDVGPRYPDEWTPYPASGLEASGSGAFVQNMHQCHAVVNRLLVTLGSQQIIIPGGIVVAASTVLPHALCAAAGMRSLELDDAMGAAATAALLRPLVCGKHCGLEESKQAEPVTATPGAVIVQALREARLLSLPGGACPFGELPRAWSPARLVYMAGFAWHQMKTSPAEQFAVACALDTLGANVVFLRGNVSPASGAARHLAALIRAHFAGNTGTLVIPSDAGFGVLGGGESGKATPRPDSSSPCRSTRVPTNQPYMDAIAYWLLPMCARPGTSMPELSSAASRDVLNTKAHTWTGMTGAPILYAGVAEWTARQLPELLKSSLMKQRRASPFEPSMCGSGQDARVAVKFSHDNDVGLEPKDNKQRAESEDSLYTAAAPELVYGLHKEVCAEVTNWLQICTNLVQPVGVMTGLESGRRCWSPMGVMALSLAAQARSQRHAPLAPILVLVDKCDIRGWTLCLPYATCDTSAHVVVTVVEHLDSKPIVWSNGQYTQGAPVRREATSRMLAMSGQLQGGGGGGVLVMTWEDATCMLPSLGRHPLAGVVAHCSLGRHTARNACGVSYTWPSSQHATVPAMRPMKVMSPAATDPCAEPDRNGLPYGFAEFVPTGTGVVSSQPETPVLSLLRSHPRAWLLYVPVDDTLYGGASVARAGSSGVECGTQRACNELSAKFACGGRTRSGAFDGYGHLDTHAGIRRAAPSGMNDTASHCTSDPESHAGPTEDVLVALARSTADALQTFTDHLPVRMAAQSKPDNSQQVSSGMLYILSWDANATLLEHMSRAANDESLSSGINALTSMWRTSNDRYDRSSSRIGPYLAGTPGHAVSVGVSRSWAGGYTSSNRLVVDSLVSVQSTHTVESLGSWRAMVNEHRVLDSETEGLTLMLRLAVYAVNRKMALRPAESLQLLADGVGPAVRVLKANKAANGDLLAAIISLELTHSSCAASSAGAQQSASTSDLLAWSRHGRWVTWLECRLVSAGCTQQVVTTVRALVSVADADTMSAWMTRLWHSRDLASQLWKAVGGSCAAPPVPTVPRITKLALEHVAVWLWFAYGRFVYGGYNTDLERLRCHSDVGTGAQWPAGCRSVSDTAGLVSTVQAWLSGTTSPTGSQSDVGCGPSDRAHVHSRGSLQRSCSASHLAQGKEPTTNTMQRPRVLNVVDVGSQLDQIVCTSFQQWPLSLHQGLIFYSGRGLTAVFSDQCRGVDEALRRAGVEVTSIDGMHIAVAGSYRGGDELLADVAIIETMSVCHAPPLVVVGSHNSEEDAATRGNTLSTLARFADRIVLHTA